VRAVLAEQSIKLGTTPGGLKGFASNQRLNPTELRDQVATTGTRTGLKIKRCYCTILCCSLYFRSMYRADSAKPTVHAACVLLCS